ncbi:hypothetical protein AB6C48_18810, partial [Vibrio splendidus]
ADQIVGSGFSSTELRNKAHFISCKIESDEFTFNELFNVTLYEYKGRKIIIDNSGKSLSFPAGFKGVTCE